MARRSNTGLALSLWLGVLAFLLDRIHKFVQVSADCIAIGQAACVSADMNMVVPTAPFDWRGGEIVRVTDFFDYVLVWNTGISYGLLGDMPLLILGAVIVVAIVALGFWWWRADQALVRSGLMLAIGGALSNGLDRLLYGAVADFFHFHWQDYSFYIFNIADVAISLGVLLLILDLLGIGRPKPVSRA